MPFGGLAAGELAAGDGLAAAPEPGVFNTIRMVWARRLEPPLSRPPLSVRLRQTFLLFAHRTFVAPLSPPFLAPRSAPWIHGLPFSTAVATEVGDHGMEEANAEELVEEDRVYPLKGRLELIRLGSHGLQPFVVVPSVDLVDLQPTMRHASENAAHFAWAH